MALMANRKALGSRFQYTGQIAISEVGLYYYKARFYAPSLGRFLQADPLGYVDGLNFYTYVGGDPVNLTDPTGLYSSCRNTGRHDENGSQVLECTDDGGGSSGGAFAGGGASFGGGGSFSGGGISFGGGVSGVSNSGMVVDTMSGGDIPCLVGDCIRVTGTRVTNTGGPILTLGINLDVVAIIGLGVGGGIYIDLDNGAIGVYGKFEESLGIDLSVSGSVGVFTNQSYLNGEYLGNSAGAGIFELTGSNTPVGEHGLGLFTGGELDVGVGLPFSFKLSKGIGGSSCLFFCGK
ncbi:MAG: RHS repeat-associated core domain-containing protein [Sphingomonadales bacterium]|jgi:RHS repeat-associated protein